MANDPAFLFFPNDYLGGTLGLTFEMKGAYIELLIMQFNSGKFTEAQAQLVLSICSANAWDMLKQKFKTDGEYFWNERLQIEMEKRKKFTESRRNNALGKNKEKENLSTSTSICKASAEHMENRNRNENKDKNRNVILLKKKFIPPTFEDIEAYCKEKGYTIDIDHFINFYETIDWFVGKRKMVKWKTAVANATKWERNQNLSSMEDQKFSLEL